MAKDPYRYFRIEARELCEQLGKGLLALEQGAYQPEHIASLLRWAHTLKGAARVVRQAEIADLIHGMEDLLAPLRTDPTPLPRASIDQVLAALDSVNAHLARLPAAEAASPAAPASTLDRPHEAAAPGVPAWSPSQPSPPSGQPAQAVPAGGAALAMPPDGLPRMARADIVEVDVLLEGLGEIGAELAAMRRAIASRDQRAMEAGAERIARELQQTRDAAERLRLVPVASIFSALERGARDAAHSCGKEVQLIATGGAMRVDGDVLDAVQGALLQLVRNAVAHGIETPDVRRASGKPPCGRITLDASRRGNSAYFRCSDDGGGIDLAAVHRMLLQRHPQGPVPHAADSAGLIDALLQGGISTSARVTELAGRGIGMDVARTALARVGGSLQASTSAAGAVFELRVPLILAALEVLLLEADGQTMALPLDAVHSTLRVAADDVVQAQDGQSVVFDNQLLPLLPLTLGHRARQRHQWTPRALTAVVVGTTAGRLALAAGRLCGVDSVVLRALPALAPAEPTVLGLYLDPEGDPRIVLDPDQLGAALSARRNAGRDTAPDLAPILVVDDSLTTRMLESSILESAGYQVALAASAEEGLEMAARTAYALFLVDVEMPGMNGFEFVATVRADPRLRDIPAILVTSLDTAAHKQRGLDAGAQDYIVKSEFDQGAFLARIGELVRP